MKRLFDLVEEALGIKELYHYTHVGNLLNMIKTDSFIYSADDGFNYGYKYYMSLTRLRNALTGIAKNFNDRNIIRLVMDEDLLRSRFKFKSVDFNFRGSIRAAIKSNWSNPDDFDKYYKDIMEQPATELEDRILSNKKEMSEFHRYIKAIHIDLMRVNDDEIKKIEDYCKKYDIDLQIMTKRQFELGKIKYK